MDDQSGSRFSAADRVRSFRFALRGIATLVRTEHNARIHLAAAIAVVGLALLLDVARDGWLWLVVAIAGVFCAEAANTALERLADATAPDRHPLIEQAKDIAAGGVLIAAIAAGVIGLLVLGPPLWSSIAAVG